MVDGFFFSDGVALESAMEEEVSEPLQGLSFPAGPFASALLSEEEGRETLLIWIGDDFFFFLLPLPSLSQLLRDLSALAYRVASVWCNVFGRQPMRLGLFLFHLPPPPLPFS